MIQTYINNSGHLSVGSGHKIYFEDWGNPKAPPIFFLHGGPGSGFNDTYKFLFDPERHRVIFFDQRGSGKSTPFAEIKNNTTQDLVEDIEKLRNHFNVERFTLVGGSWGSSLSLFYAIAHPERVKQMILWGIFLCRQDESDYIYEGYPRCYFPEAWERFISLVPEKNRKNGDTITAYYSEKMYSKNKKTLKEFADEWTLWEMTLLSLHHDQRKLEIETLSEDNTAIARLETHYFMNKCFVPENYILDNIHKIIHIPCSVIQGRFDMCTPPVNAYDLQKAYGKNLALQWVNSGHRRTDPEIFSAIRATVLAKCSF